MSTELTPKQSAFLEMVFRDAAAEVSAKISRWAGRDFSVRFLDAGYIPLSGISAAAGEPESRIVATLLPVYSPAGGHLLFALPELSAQALVDLVLNRVAGKQPQWGEAERSAIVETGNILGSAFINVLSRSFGKAIATSTPIFFIDYPGAILQQVVMEYALSGDEALLARMRFSMVNADFEENLFFIPAPGFLEAVDASLEARGPGGCR